MGDKKSFSSEWSYRIDVDDIEPTPKSFFLSAGEDECKDVARRVGVESVEELSAKLNISRDPGGSRICIEGHLKARVVQKCVVTLEPVEAWIEEDFDAWFTDTEQALSFVKAKKDRQTRGGHVEMEITEEREDPEPIVDGKIEAGELVVQYLSLAINPYPKAEGAQYESGEDPENSREPSNIRKNPFEALKNWKSKSTE